MLNLCMKKGTPQGALIPKKILYVTVVSDTVCHEDHVPP